MIHKKLISFHPRLAAGMELFFGLMMLWWLKQIGAPWVLYLWFFFRLVLWAALIRLIFFPAGLSRLKHLLSLTIFHLGCSFLLLFIDWLPAWYLVGAFFIFVPAASFALLPARETELSFAAKPQRRWRFLMCLFGLVGIWSGLGAVVSFQIYTISYWWWLISGAIITAGIGGWWWVEYGVKPEKQFWRWLIISLLIQLELAWVIFLWPLGFLVIGFLLTWIWYIIWLLARFHLSPDGINWKKQAPFLIANAILLTIFLLWVARWR